MPIETIYIDDNSGSHFNPVRDAIRIYAVIFKYLFSSVTSFAVDYLLYWLCLGVFKLAPLLSYALARVVSSQVNYHLNKHTVFSGRGGKHSMVKYYALAVSAGADLGAGLVQFLPTVLPVSAAVVKIPVDLRALCGSATSSSATLCLTSDEDELRKSRARRRVRTRAALFLTPRLRWRGCMGFACWGWFCASPSR